MSEISDYTIHITPDWFVGYHRELDELFLYKIDHEQIVSVFRNGGIDSVGFYEFMDFSTAELLGEL